MLCSGRPVNDHYIAFKYGPHGGWHGHYDKLNFNSFARGGMVAVDPGTQSYAAKTHTTWDKVTVAHNTLVVDEKTQDEATGQLLGFAALPSVSAVRADAGNAHKQAALERALILTPEYALDVFQARATDGIQTGSTGCTTTTASPRLNCRSRPIRNSHPTTATST